jgi:hypothetical protein
MRAWDVLKGGTVVDTVFFIESMDREDVERALEHDGYVRGTFNAHSAEDRRGRWPRDRRHPR